MKMTGMDMEFDIGEPSLVSTGVAEFADGEVSDSGLVVLGVGSVSKRMLNMRAFIALS